MPKKLSQLNKNILAHRFKLLAIAGNVLTVIGCTALVLGIVGAFNMDQFALGLSSGVRTIGTVAIAGCLLSAIGYGVFDYLTD